MRCSLFPFQDSHSWEIWMEIFRIPSVCRYMFELLSNNYVFKELALNSLFVIDGICCVYRWYMYIQRRIYVIKSFALSDLKIERLLMMCKIQPIRSYLAKCQSAPPDDVQLPSRSMVFDDQLQTIVSQKS